jgi:hypothetical protein
MGPIGTVESTKNTQLTKDQISQTDQQSMLRRDYCPLKAAHDRY